MKDYVNPNLLLKKNLTKMVIITVRFMKSQSLRDIKKRLSK